MVEVFLVVNHSGLKVHRFQFKIQLEPIPQIEEKSKGSLSPSVQSSLVCRSFLLRLKSPVMVSALSLEPCYIWGRSTEVQIAASTTALSLSYESLCWPHESFHTVSLKNNHSHEFHHLTVNSAGSGGTSGDNVPQFCKAPFVLPKTDTSANKYSIISALFCSWGLRWNLKMLVYHNLGFKEDNNVLRT